MSASTTTRRSRRARRNQRSVHLSRQQARLAAAKGREARQRQAKNLKRAIPAARDEQLSATVPTTRLVRMAANVIDRDPGLVSWVTEKLEAAQGGPGRPAALSVRTGLICFWLLNVCQRNFHVINLPPMLAGLSWRVRRSLGIDYEDTHGNMKQISYVQLLGLFHNMARAFDPFTPTLTDEEAQVAASNLQELTNRLVRASVTMRAHRGDYAVDATLKWAWDRPRRRMGKIERRGRDGDAGRPVTMSAVVGADEAVTDDPAALGLVEGPVVAMRQAVGLGPARAEPPDPFGPVGGDATAGGTQAAGGQPRRGHRKGRPGTWGLGAAWVGRKPDKSKSVYGYALHTVAVEDPDFPAVVDALVVTPAPALPAPATTPLLRMLHDERLTDPDVQALVIAGAGRPIGNVTADPLYTTNAARWQLPIRDLGGDAIFRIHSTIQGGRRSVRQTTFVDGRPYCDCIPGHLCELRYPTFPYTSTALGNYQGERAKRDPFEMKPNGDYMANGSRQFKYPHWDPTTGGGCEHCVDINGNPVIDPATGLAKPKCCTRATKTFKKHDLGLYQPEVHGTDAWQKLMNPRNRVEGGYGVLKNLALVNWGHDYHHFVGLARESLVAAFAVMAMNFHLQRTWEVRQKLTAPESQPETTLPSSVPTETTPQATAAARRERQAAERDARRRGGPKGLEILGTSPSAP